MSNIEIENYFGAKDPNFEIYDKLMREKALSWTEQPGTNYHELIGDVAECAETAFANQGEIAIPDNNTRPVFVDASGEIPRVVEGSVEVDAAGLNNMYTDLYGFSEEALYDNSPVRHSSRH